MVRRRVSIPRPRNHVRYWITTVICTLVALGLASPTAAAATEPEDSQPFDIAGIRIDDSRLVLSFVLLALVLVALILVFDLIRDENREVRHWSAWLADRGIPISTEQIQASLAPSAGQQIQVDKDGNPIEPPSFQIKGPAQLIAGAPATFEIVDDAGNPQPQVAATWAIIDGTLTASDVHLYQEIGSKNTITASKPGSCSVQVATAELKANPFPIQVIQAPKTAPVGLRGFFLGSGYVSLTLGLLLIGGILVLGLVGVLSMAVLSTLLGSLIGFAFATGKQASPPVDPPAE